MVSSFKTLRKFSTSSVIALLVNGWSAPVVRADHLNFMLYNETSHSIWYLYISPARSNDWGEDVLGQDVLNSGEWTLISFPGQNPNSPCIWDIRVSETTQVRKSGQTFVSWTQ